MKTTKKKTIHYGKELAKAIKRKGITKVHVAKELGFSRVWLNELIKSGNFTPPTLKIVKKIIK